MDRNTQWKCIFLSITLLCIVCIPVLPRSISSLLITSILAIIEQLDTHYKLKHTIIVQPMAYLHMNELVLFKVELMVMIEP